MIQPDPRVDVSDAAKVTLGGVDWYVPVLPLRQTMKIVPLASTVGTLRPDNVSEESIIALSKVVHLGLTRVYPTLTYDQFLDLRGVSFDELTAAAAVVLAQTKAKKPAGEGDLAGEALAASPSTGPDSSPTS